METGILGKHENWGISILQIGGRILMKFDIYKEFMSQSSYFKSRPDLLTLGGVGGGNLGKHFEWRNRDEAWWIE